MWWNAPSLGGPCLRPKSPFLRCVLGGRSRPLAQGSDLTAYLSQRVISVGHERRRESNRRESVVVAPSRPCGPILELPQPGYGLDHLLLYPLAGERLDCGRDVFLAVRVAPLVEGLQDHLIAAKLDVEQKLLGLEPIDAGQRSSTIRKPTAIRVDDWKVLSLRLGHPAGVEQEHREYLASRLAIVGERERRADPLWLARCGFTNAARSGRRLDNEPSAIVRSRDLDLGAMNLAVRVTASTAGTQQPHHVLESVANALSTVRVLVVELALLGRHGLLDRVWHPLSELVSPRRPRLTLEDWPVVHEHMSSCKVRSDAGPLRLEHERDPGLAEDDSKTSEEWVCLSTQAPIVELVLVQDREAAAASRAGRDVTTGAVGWQDPPMHPCAGDPSVEVARQLDAATLIWTVPIGRVIPNMCGAVYARQVEPLARISRRAGTRPLRDVPCRLTDHQRDVVPLEAEEPLVEVLEQPVLRPVLWHHGVGRSVATEERHDGSRALLDHEVGEVILADLDDYLAVWPERQQTILATIPTDVDH